MTVMHVAGGNVVLDGFDVRKADGHRLAV